MNIEEIKKYFTENSVSDIELAFNKALSSTNITVLKNMVSKLQESSNENFMSNDQISELSKEIHYILSNNVYNKISLPKGKTIYIDIKNKFKKSSLIKALSTNYKVTFDLPKDNNTVDIMLFTKGYHLSGSNTLTHNDKKLIKQYEFINTNNTKIINFLQLSLDINVNEDYSPIDEEKLILMLCSGDFNIFKLAWSILWNSTYIPQLEINSYNDIILSDMSNKQRCSFIKTTMILYSIKNDTMFLSNIRTLSRIDPIIEDMTLVRYKAFIWKTIYDIYSKRYSRFNPDSLLSDIQGIFPGTFNNDITNWYLGFSI
jgi:hypothetical protein